MKKQITFYIICISALALNCSTSCKIQESLAFQLYRSEQPATHHLIDHHGQEPLDRFNDHLNALIENSPTENGNSIEYDSDTEHPYGHSSDFSISIEELIASTYIGFRAFIETITTYLQ